MKKKEKPPIKVQVVEKKKMTPEQIAARERTKIANVAEKVFNSQYST